ARLESVYRPKAYRGFESLTLRNQKMSPPRGGFCICSSVVKAKLCAERLQMNNATGRSNTFFG
ncbi:MAG TPA: hypothetical protein PK076_04910, partial [Saprospiraceae bacterium]|nr:hypothetical protein [Saprospiraceae bacterium]